MKARCSRGNECTILERLSRRRDLHLLNSTRERPEPNYLHRCSFETACDAGYFGLTVISDEVMRRSRATHQIVGAANCDAMQRKQLKTRTVTRHLHTSGTIVTANALLTLDAVYGSI